MAKKYYIKERKEVIYTHLVYANSKAEARQKYENHGDIEEIGQDFAGNTTIRIVEIGPATANCAVCGDTFSPNNVRDYRCKPCEKNKR